MTALAEEILATIRDVPDFPKPGIVFKDIGPLLRSPKLLYQVVTHMEEVVRTWEATVIVAIESRGFLFGAPLAVHCQLPFVPVRKQGKLPGDVVSESYDLEYGTDHIEIQSDGIKPSDRVVIVDDVLATGGTAKAAAALVRKQGAKVVGHCFLLELAFLNGAKNLSGPLDVLARVK